jgi:hypothetical protein
LEVKLANDNVRSTWKCAKKIGQTILAPMIYIYI